MSERLAAEALVAVTGIWPRRPPSLDDMLAAEGMLDRWRGRYERLLRGEQRPFKWQPPPRDMEARITTRPPQDEATRWLAELGDPAVGVEYASTIAEAREYLAALLPQETIEGVVPEARPPGRDERDEVWSVARVLDDPETLMDDAESWAVTASQVTAWTAIYRELSVALSAALTNEIVEHVAKGRAISWQVESVIRTLRGVPPEAPLRLPAPVEPKPPAPPAARVDFAATRTPAEQVANG